MKHYFQTHPLSKTGMLVAPLLLIIFLMGQFFPAKAPEGFSSFIVAFEFAKTPADIQHLFSDLTENAIHNIDVGNYLDFAFMTTYTIILTLSFLKFSREHNKKWLKLGTFFALIIFLGDFAENIFLLRLTENYLSSASEETLISNLGKLHIFTWIKWIGLSVCFAFFYSLFYRKHWYARIAGIVFLLPLLFLLAMPNHGSQCLTIFTNLIFLCFAILIIYLFLYKSLANKKS